MPRACAHQAAELEDLDVFMADNLDQVVRWLHRDAELPHPVLPTAPPAPRFRDLSEVRGQTLARRALEIAAAGGLEALLNAMERNPEDPRTQASGCTVLENVGSLPEDKARIVAAGGVAGDEAAREEADERRGDIVGELEPRRRLSR